MKTVWWKGVDKDQEDPIREYYIQGLQMRKRMKVILNEEIESLHNDMLNEAHFESPNWALVQADRLAQIKALKRVISLIE